MALDKKAFFALTTDLTSGASYLKVFTPATTTVIDVYSDEGGTDLALDQVPINQTTGVAVFWVNYGTYDLKIYNTADEQVGATLSSVYITRPAEAGDNVETTLGVATLDTRLKKGSFGIANATTNGSHAGVLLIDPEAMIHTVDSVATGTYSDIKRWDGANATTATAGEVIILQSTANIANGIVLTDSALIALPEDRIFGGASSLMLIRNASGWQELSFTTTQSGVSDSSIGNRLLTITGLTQPDLRQGGGVYELTGASVPVLASLRWHGQQYIPHATEITLYNAGSATIALNHAEAGALGTTFSLPGSQSLSLAAGDGASFVAVGDDDERKLHLVSTTNTAGAPSAVVANSDPILTNNTLAVGLSTHTLLLAPQGNDTTPGVTANKKENAASARDSDYDLQVITGGYNGQKIRVTVDFLNAALPDQNSGDGYVQDSRNIRGTTRFTHALTSALYNGRIFLQGWNQLKYVGGSGVEATPVEADYVNSDCRLMAGDYLTLQRRGIANGNYWWEEIDRHYDPSVTSVMTYTGHSTAGGTTAPSYNVAYSLVCRMSTGALSSVGVWRPQHSCLSPAAASGGASTDEVRVLNADTRAGFQVIFTRYTISRDMTFGVNVVNDQGDGGVRGFFGQDNLRGAMLKPVPATATNEDANHQVIVTSVHVAPSGFGGDFNAAGDGTLIRWGITSNTRNFAITES